MTRSKRIVKCYRENGPKPCKLLVFLPFLPFLCFWWACLDMAPSICLWASQLPPCSHFIPRGFYFEVALKKSKKTSHQTCNKTNPKTMSWIAFTFFHSPSLGNKHLREALRRNPILTSCHSLRVSCSLQRLGGKVHLFNSSHGFPWMTSSRNRWITTLLVSVVLLFKQIRPKCKKLEKQLFLKNFMVQSNDSSIAWSSGYLELGVRSIWLICKCFSSITLSVCRQNDVAYVHVLHDPVVVPLRLSESEKTWFIQAEKHHQTLKTPRSDKNPKSLHRIGAFKRRLTSSVIFWAAQGLGHGSWKFIYLVVITVIHPQRVVSWKWAPQPMLLKSELKNCQWLMAAQLQVHGTLRGPGMKHLIYF